MIDLRYHIYSLVAVFLALALGILIGAAFIAPGTSDGKEIIRRRTLITELEKRFDVLREEIDEKQELAASTQSLLDQTEQVCKALIPAAVAGRLSYRNVAIIQTGGSDEAVSAVRSALAQAGARVTVFARVEDEMSPDSARVTEVAQSLGLDADCAAPEAYNAALAATANCLVWAKEAEKLAAMERSNLITISGSVNHWNRLVVLVGGAESAKRDRAQALDVPLIDLLQKKGAQVVGCEDFNAPVSYVGAYAGKGISTVDNIDQAAGQIGLVYALTGERGNFGVKKTADRLIPRTLENYGN
ncbi:MAG: copper transporter [Armatimonadota bacterium]|nr:copper transporter [Armatimonadota bacterium]